MKIYLAGKIAQVANWRADIVDMSRWKEKSYAYGTWEVLPKAIFGTHDYTGPYWSDHHNETLYSRHIRAASHNDPDPDEKFGIVQNCLMAVSSSDLVFAQLFSGRYSPGTIAEIAWAWQQRIPIIGYGDSDSNEDDWFPRRMCTKWYNAARGSEADALRAHLQLVPYRQHIDSPRWREFADSIKRERGNRCQVCNATSRLDAHHRTYERLGWEDANDITVLCRSCHALYERTKAPR